MEPLATRDARLTCESCGCEAMRSLGAEPDPFCHRCGDLMRIVDLVGRPAACQGRRWRRRLLALR